MIWRMSAVKIFSLRNKKIAVVLAIASTVIGLFLIGPAAHAQTAAFPDVPENHWAYQAVQELADKGYIKGYPDGRFLGGRAMTRYEFATVIDRMVQTVDDLSQKVAAGQAPATPTGAPVTQDDLNKIQVLVDAFQAQLTAIQSTEATDKAHFQSEIDKLRSDLAAVKTEADNSYGAGSGRKYSISGYIQARYLSVGSGNSKDYPQGNPSSSSPYNGTYEQGSNSQSFLVRRSRLKVTGQPTTNTRFDIQIDASGFANNTPSSSSNSTNAALTVKEGWVSYTFGNGQQPSNNPYQNGVITAGQFATPFGYMLPLGTNVMNTPERPLAFNEGSAGIFANQDYDKGLQLAYSPSFVRLLFAAINGDGSINNDESHQLDEVYKVGVHTKDNVLSADASWYQGHLPDTKTAASPYPGYIDLKKDLWDVDAQAIAPNGPFLLGEYMAGRYDERDYFGGSTTVINPLGFTTAEFVPGNHIKGYYIQGGWTFDKQGAHPFTLFLDYDALNRSDSGVAASATGGASGSTFDDVNWGYGALYNVDKALRLRLYYIKPNEVAHAVGTPEPSKVGLTTAEVQVSF